MTTAQDSRRSSGAAALVVAAVVVATATGTSAHRLDEYLQAARIDVGTDRVRIELDLTPGTAIAPTVLADIDRDKNGLVSADEADAYSRRVLDEIRLDIDNQMLPLQLTDRRFPAVRAIVNGEGTIQLRFLAALPVLAAGSHHLSFRNDHRPGIGVYLANALVPASREVSVRAQRRDVDQRGLAIDYVLGGEPPLSIPWWMPLGGLVLMAAITDAVTRRRARRRGVI